MSEYTDLRHIFTWRNRPISRWHHIRAVGIVQAGDIHFLLTRNVTKKLSQTSEPSSGLSDDRFELRPQRRVNLEA